LGDDEPSDERRGGQGEYQTIAHKTSWAVSDAPRRRITRW
jgi:hypothetical protein